MGLKNLFGGKKDSGGGPDSKAMGSAESSSRRGSRMCMYNHEVPKGKKMCQHRHWVG